MDNKKFTIDYPSGKEVNHEISTIIKAGLIKKKTFYSFLKAMHNQLGWKYIFRDYVELVFIGLFFILLMVGFALYLHIIVNWDASRLYTYLFIASPLLYGVISIIPMMEKKETWESEMVCKYNLYQVAAYRMLVFSCVSIIFNVVQILFCSVFFKEINIAQAIMISLTALFLFSIMFIYITTHIHSRIIQVMIALGWILLNSGIVAMNKIFYYYIIVNIPNFVYCLIIIAAGSLYIKNLKKLALKGAKDYVISSIY